MSYSQTSIAKLAAIALGFAMAFGVAYSVALPRAHAVTTEELQAQITALLAQITALQAQLSAQTGGTTGTGYTFTRNLRQGNTGEDVRQLQILLNSDTATRVAVTGAGSPGNETTYFGPATRAAVIKFQQKYAAEVLTPLGLTSGTGFFGASSRAKANALGGPVATTPPTTPPGTTPPPAPAGTGITVAAAAQPASGLAPQSAARVPFTRFTLTAGSDGDVIVNSVTVERTGLAADAAFAGVVLIDEETGLQVGIAKTFNSNHQATVGEAVTVKRGTTKTFALSGNMAADNSGRAGQVATLTLIGVNTSATVSGTLPITGASHTINASLSLGSVTNERGPLDPNAAQEKNVGTSAYTFSSVKVTAGSVEDIRVHSLRWNQASSAGASDLANLVTVVDGVEYPTVLSADGKFYTSTFGSGIVIPKGLSKEFSMKGDIVGGSGRTVAFNIEKTTDIYITGELYKYGITPPTSGTGFSSGTIWYAGKTVTIATGSLTVEKAAAVPAQNIAINLSNQPLGGFTVEVKGEPITVASINFNISTTGTKVAGSVATLTNVTIVDQNGAVVAGPSDCDSACDDIVFTDTVLFPVGKNTYTIKGKAGVGHLNNATIIFDTVPSTDWTTVTGQVTGKTVTPSSATVTMNTMTVKSAALTISVAATPAAQTVVSGAQQFTFANYQLDASASGEDLSMSSIPLEYNAASGPTNLTSCNLYDGSIQLTTGSNTVNPSAAASSTTFTFDKPLTVPKGTVKTLGLKCNIAASATGTYAWGYNDASSPSATGVTSGQSATITENDSAGQLMTLATAGSLTVSLDSSSPSYTVAAAGSTGNTVGVLRIRASNEAVTINEIGLQLPISASSSPSEITRVTLWDGSTKVADTVFTTRNYTASTTVGNCAGCGSLVVPKDTDKLVTIKVDIAAQGTSEVGTPGALIAINWDGDGAQGSSGGIAGTGASSGTKITASGTDTAVSGIRVYRSYPTLALVSLPSSKLVAGRQDLFRFKVTASPQGDVGIAEITFRIATSSATAQLDMIDAVNVYVFTDDTYSTVASGVQNDGAFLATSQDLSSMWVSASTDIRIGALDSSAASTTVVIPAGGTRYFAIKGDVVTAGTQFSVSTQLQGDSQFATANTAGATTPYRPTATSTYLATSTFIHDTHAENDFVWRPFSTTTAQSLNANDYTNGYGVPGLPNSNTNSQILTQ